jgi:TonB-dependent receptor
VAATAVAAGSAVEEQKRSYRLPHGEAVTILAQFATESGRPILFMMDAVRGEQTNALTGSYTPREALDRLLAGTALVAVHDPKSGGFIINRRASTSKQEQAEAEKARGPPNGHATPLPATPKTAQPNLKESPAMQRKNVVTVVVTFFASLFGSATPNFASAVNAGGPLTAITDVASAANLSGHISDANTGKYLDGAEISVEGTEIRVTTAREGIFQIGPLNPGPITLIVRYPGLNERREGVVLAAGKTTTVAIRLSDSEVLQMEQFRVASSKEGMAQAIAAQKAARNSLLVAATDQFGDMAEGGNAAEYLKFLPGIGVDYANNEARSVSLRGLSSSFTSVNFDNNPLASASSASLSRTFEFEQVAVNNVETVEVFKTVLPDQPATSTGGAINLVSKSAFDREGSRLNYRVFIAATSGAIDFQKTPGWGQGLSHKLMPGFDVNFATRLRENLGMNITVSDSQRYTNMARSEYIPEFNPANGASPDNPALSGWHLLNEQKVTNRRGASGKLDWRPAPRTKISLNGQWNWFDMTFSQRDLRVFTGALAPLAVGQARVYTDDAVVGLPTRGSVPLNQLQSWKHGVTYAGGAALEHTFAFGGKLNGGYYWSQSFSKYRNASEGYYSTVNTNLTGVTVTLRDLERIVPTFRVTDSTGAPVNIDDPSRRVINNLSHFSRTGVDTRDGFSLDYTQNLRTWLRLKIGGRRDDVGRNIHNLSFGRGTNFTGAALTALIDPVWSGRSLGFGTPGNNWPSIYRAYETYGPMPSTPAGDVLARFDERTDSTYVRGDLQLSSKLLVVGGVRRETRESLNVDRKAGVRGMFADKGNFPSLNVKYSLQPNLLFRLGAAETIGLPNFSDLNPSAFSVVEPNEETGADGRIANYNRNLRPYVVKNYDLSAEYYFKHSGFLSASIFRKDFYNYIISASQELTAASAASVGLDTSTLSYPAERYNLTTRFNVKDPGRYTGLELAYAQTLSFLPKPLNTLGVQINYTALKVDGIKTSQVFEPVDRALDASVREQVQNALNVNAVKELMNFVVNYRLGRWNTVVSTNYTGKVLRSISRKTIRYSGTAANAYLNEYVYSSPRALVDLRLDYRWSARFTPYLQVRNLFNRSQENLTFDRFRSYTTYGDPMFEFGVRGVW